MIADILSPGNIRFPGGQIQNHQYQYTVSFQKPEKQIEQGGPIRTYKVNRVKTTWDSWLECARTEYTRE